MIKPCAIIEKVASEIEDNVEINSGHEELSSYEEIGV